jgi:uncharacterized membrane protein YcaP (DUF421 family)
MSSTKRATRPACRIFLYKGMQLFWDFITPLVGLGAEPKNLTFLQIVVRGFIVFVAGLIMLRLGDRRALAQKTAFDTLLIVLLASVLSRAINGSAAFFATIGGSFVMVLMHRLLAQVCCASHAIGVWVKGEPYILVKDGEYRRPTMRKKSVSQHDIEEDMRLSAKVEDVSEIKIARLERSGDLSFIKET